MKQSLSLLLSFTLLLALAGCTGPTEPATEPPTIQTTVPPETTLPPEPTLPPETTQPSGTTQPPVTEPPSEEDRIEAAALAFLDLHMRNLWLCEENDWDALTVLAPESKDAALADYRDNIKFLHEKERYWRAVRQDSPRHSWSTNHTFQSIIIDGNVATVKLSYGYAFVYEGMDVESGGVAELDLILVNVDGVWLLADALEASEWFDAQYHDVPGFTADELIAQLNAGTQS